jgi:tetratricopeptide (TPR) repeat protein
MIRGRTPGGLSDAIAEIRTAVQIQPTSAIAHCDLGNVLALIGRPAEAVAEYDAALRLAPEYPQAYVGRGAALLALGRQPEAIAAYENALRILPCYADAHYGMGNVLLETPGRRGDALSEFEAAVGCQPDYAPAVKKLQQLEHGQ